MKQIKSFQKEKIQHKLAKYRAWFHSADYEEGDWEGQPLWEKEMHREGEGTLEEVGNEGKKNMGGKLKISQNQK